MEKRKNKQKNKSVIHNEEELNRLVRLFEILITVDKKLKKNTEMKSSNEKL